MNPSVNKDSNSTLLIDELIEYNRSVYSGHAHSERVSTIQLQVTVIILSTTKQTILCSIFATLFGPSRYYALNQMMTS